MAYLYKNHIPTQSPKITVSRMRIFTDQQWMIGNRDADYMDSVLSSMGDDEWNGLGNSYDFGARIYDSRVGRFFAMDQVGSKLPMNSPYCFAANNPLDNIDKDGKFPVGFNWLLNKQNKK